MVINTKIHCSYTYSCPTAYVIRHSKAPHRRPSFPWQVFPWQGALFKSCISCQLLNKAPCQGKTCQFMSYTRANKTCQRKTCQGKLGRLCGALSQGKLVQLYTRAIKTCQGKLLEKNLFIVHTSRESWQETCQGKLGRLCGA